jgi:hypothetical protein
MSVIPSDLEVSENDVGRLDRVIRAAEKHEPVWPPGSFVHLPQRPYCRFHHREPGPAGRLVGTNELDVLRQMLRVAVALREVVVPHDRRRVEHRVQSQDQPVCLVGARMGHEDESDLGRHESALDARSDGTSDSLISGAIRSALAHTEWRGGTAMAP